MTGTSTGGTEAWSILAAIEVRPEHRDEFLALTLETIRENLRDRARCLRFELTQDSTNPNRFGIYEVWRDRETFLAHREEPHFLRWRAAFDQWQAGDVQACRGPVLLASGDPP